MSMSTHLVGFKTPDETWTKMKAIWDACNEADVSIPEEVTDFFEDNAPDSAGVKVSEKTLIEAGVVKHYNNSAHMHNGYDIYVNRLPAGVNLIRVYNSY